MNNQPITRTDALYDLLCERGGWMRLSEIYWALDGLYAPLKLRTFTHDSAARRQITADINAINGSPRYEKVIIHGDGGVKIASDEEAARYVASRAVEAKKQLRQIGVLRDKIGGARVMMEV